MQIFIYGNDKLRNSTKTKEGGASRECLLKKDTGVVRPIIEIKGENMSMFNYAFIPDFHRYYYIVEWTSLNAHMWQAQLEVDVLATYREHILASYAFVQYAESDYDTMIPDSRLPVSDRFTGVSYSYPFGAYDAGGSFVLSIASSTSSGNRGMAQVVSMSKADMRALAAKLGDRSFIKEVSESFAQPLDMVLSAIWLPVAPSSVGGSPIRLGDFDTGVSGGIVGDTRHGEEIITFDWPHKAILPDGSETFADYRNVEPYSEYSIRLPGVGLVQLPSSSLIGDGSRPCRITVWYDIDYVTGDVAYKLVRAGDTTEFLICSGQLGHPVPIFNSNYNVSGALTSLISGGASIAATVGGIVTGNPLMAIGGFGGAMTSAINGTLKANQSQYTIAGRLGSQAANSINNAIEVLVRSYETSDTVSNAAPVIGAPCFKRKKLGDLSGYVKCSGVRIECNATAEEFRMLSDYLEASANYQYGGIIIE